GLSEGAGRGQRLPPAGHAAASVASRAAGAADGPAALPGALTARKVAAERLETALGDRLAHGGHQRLEESDVVPGEQHLAEDLLGLHQVVQIGPRIVAAGRAVAGLVQRRLVLGEAGVLQVDRPVPGPRLAVAARAGR